MNETNLTQRQRAVLGIINRSRGLSQGEIRDRIQGEYRISKPTVIRDLGALLKNNVICAIGKGKNTRYVSKETNPLLRFVDPPQYFLREPDERVDARRQFDHGIFAHLHNLFTPAEEANINSISKSFSAQIQQLSHDIVQKELERFIIELSWKSSKIEGNTYSLLETERLIKESQKTPGKTTEEAVMILNHKKTFEQIMTHRDAFCVLSVSTINQLHNFLVRDMPVEPGIRRQAVGITGTVYVPPDNEHQLREAMERLLRVINETPFAFEKALVAFAMIPYIQPYADGNKRTARMTANAILLAHDCYPLSYRSIDEDEYKKALILFYEQESLVEVKRLFLEQLEFAYTTYFQ